MSFSPLIEDKDIIIVDREASIDAGDIVACLFQGELHLGRLKKIAGELYLENNLGRIKLQDCQVAAPVIEITRRLK
jgi:SOS-response transcriptional repressor LexA